MKKIALTALLSLLLVACGDDSAKTAVPAAQMLSDSSIGHYCMMNLNEHTGPKAQLYVKSRADKPYWFSTVKQMFMFRQLPEEPKDIIAMYVTDMAKVTDWSKANADSDWIDATKAYYVIKSPFVGGMGAEDALPFSDKAKAEAFVAEHGGEITTFDAMPEDYIFEQGGMSHAQHGAMNHGAMSHQGHAMPSTSAPEGHANHSAMSHDTHSHEMGHSDAHGGQEHNEHSHDMSQHDKHSEQDAHPHGMSHSEQGHSGTQSTSQ